MCLQMGSSLMTEMGLNLEMARENLNLLCVRMDGAGFRPISVLTRPKS